MASSASDIRDTARDAASHAANAASEATDRVKSTFDRSYGQLQEDFERLRKQFMDLSSGASEEARTRLSEGLGTLSSRVDEFTRDASQYGGKKFHDAERAVQDRPITSVLIAFGVGLVLANLLRR